MGKGFAHLVASGRIGAMTVANRIVMPAMDMNISVAGHIGAAEVEHFAARARGGAGLVTTGASAVAYPIGATSRKQPGLSSDEFLPGLRALADGVHEAGGKVCVQLCHHGRIAAVDVADGRPMLVPSKPDHFPDLRALIDTVGPEQTGLANAREGGRDTFREADEADIEGVVHAFADAAARCQAAGIDAVEVHAGHGYLLNGFLSAGYNRRTDGWGGSLENRARITVDVLHAIRARVGAGYPVLVKMNGIEHGLPGGCTPAEVVAAARIFEAAGADAIHVSGYADDPFADFTIGPLPSAVAAYREVTRAVKAAVGIPVIAVGRMLPEVAEEMLAAGECDFAAMGRQLLADPDLAAKIAAGRRAAVRPCINCYVCVAQNFFDETPRCAVNPALHDQGTQMLPRATTSKRVVVVGGGPGGMEAARLAAQRGHDVTVLERDGHLGGTAWFSQLTTPANEPLLAWLRHELAMAGVEVRTGTTATPELVRALAPDVVVVATGARRARPDIPGAPMPHVHTGDDLRALLAGGRAPGAPRPAAWRDRLARVAIAAGRLVHLTDRPAFLRRASRWWMPLGRRVVVIGGGLVGLELAEYLAERGREVTVLEDGPVLGLPMALPRRLAAVGKATAHHVALVRGATVTAIDRTSVTYTTGAEDHTVPADTVVVAAGVEPDPTVADELRTAGFDVRVVGDAAEVAYIEGAIHSAWRVAAEL